MNAKTSKAKPQGDAAFPVPDAGTFRQSEPHPEDLPASARVTPPAEQLNSALSQAVGQIGNPAHDPASDAIAEGIARHRESVAEGYEKAHRIADLKAELRELEGQG